MEAIKYEVYSQCMDCSIGFFDLPFDLCFPLNTMPQGFPVIALLWSFIDA
jgi:hypothetical protein